MFTKLFSKAFLLHLKISSKEQQSLNSAALTEALLWGTQHVAIEAATVASHAIRVQQISKK